MRGSSGFLANPNETEWIPVELELVDRIWLPDTEILRLKGFHSLSVLDRLQVSNFLAVVLTLYFLPGLIGPSLLKPLQYVIELMLQTHS